MRSNFHTHSVFCDGKDTPEETVQKALSLGFRALGFSGHSYTDFDPCGMTPESEDNYRAEIARLKIAYTGRIEIYCGVEQDYFSGRRRDGYDYAIGSVHYVRRDGEYLCVDWSGKRTGEILRRRYGGDPYAFAEDYFALVGQVRDVTGCDIIGHFDLIKKFDEDGAVFDESHPRYRAAVMGALDALCPSLPIFEINTGAMARGCRKTPFPSLWILKELCARGCPIMLSTDCHDREKLDFGVETAREIARAAGYRCRMVLHGGRWEEAEL